MVGKAEYYKRQIELWGEERQESLQDKAIAIIGAGGLGSSLALALSGSGIGDIDVVDFDRISPHNIHRQIAFRLEDEGRYKAKVVSELIRARNPFVKSRSFEMHFEDFAKLEKKYDLLLDATDNFEARLQLSAYSKKSTIPWIYASVEEFMGQVCFFEHAGFETFNTKAHTPGGIAAPIVMQVASFEANLALRYLVDVKVARDTLYYMQYNNEGKFGLKSFTL
ncbi:MAG: ThiF family adenylyltransferase [Campylobacterales bacterium]|nr:ThiF family adenylyltransferase [Campylobacterales bacterium]